jgi:hypothetical protein
MGEKGWRGEFLQRLRGFEPRPRVTPSARSLTYIWLTLKKIPQYRPNCINILIYLRVSEVEERLRDELQRNRGGAVQRPADRLRQGKRLLRELVNRRPLPPLRLQLSK